MASEKILFVVPRFHPNLFYATRALVEAGFHVSVFASRSGTLEDWSSVSPRLLSDESSREEVAAALDAVKPDIVFLRYSRKMSQHVRALSRARDFSVWVYHQQPATKRLTLRQRLGLWYHRRKPEHCVTPVPGHDLHAPRDGHVRYLPWPVAATPGVARRDAPNDRLRILCVGKLAQRRKNQDLLIEAIRRAKIEDRVLVTLVGSTSRKLVGADEDHFHMLQDCAAQYDWLDLRMDVPFAEMPGIYASSDICVLPSRKEPLGTAPIEAMCYGVVPLISCDAGSAGYITEGVDGLRIDISGPDALSSALLRLLENPAERMRMAKEALRTTETELSPARFVDRVRDLIDERPPKSRRPS